jgi:hypothetical protein
MSVQSSESQATRAVSGHRDGAEGGGAAGADGRRGGGSESERGEVV